MNIYHVPSSMLSTNPTFHPNNPQSPHFIPMKTEVLRGDVGIPEVPQVEDAGYESWQIQESELLDPLGQEQPLWPEGPNP